LKIISDLHSLSRIAFCRKTKTKKHITTLKELGIYIFLKDTTLEALNKTKKKFIHFARQFHQQFIDYGHGLFTT
jgi:ADP-glucose pyrophosphorylase